MARAEAVARTEKRAIEEEFKAKADALAVKKAAEYEVRMKGFEAMVEARAKEQAEANTAQQLQVIMKEQAEARTLLKEENQAQQLTQSAAHAEAQHLKEQLFWQCK